jgi:hypothetical protein
MQKIFRFKISNCINEKLVQRFISIILFYCSFIVRHFIIKSDEHAE